MAGEQRVYYAEGSIRVTSTSFRSGTRTFALATIEKIQLRRPALAFAAAFGGALWGFVVAFSDLLYPIEIVNLLWPPLVAVAGASQFGVLTVDSKALTRDLAGYGLYKRLRLVHAALDQALEDSQHQAGRSRSASGGSSDAENRAQ